MGKREGERGRIGGDGEKRVLFSFFLTKRV